MDVWVIVICALTKPTKQLMAKNVIILINNIQNYEICIRFQISMAPEGLYIRSYRNEDAAAVLGIYEYYILIGPYTFETSVPEISAFSARLHEIAGRFPFYVLEKENKIIGYAYACTHRERAAYRWAVETSIYLAKDTTGKGFGKMLYNSLLATLKERHFTHAFALIGLPNEPSIQLHNSCGFTEQTIHKKAGFKNGCWIDVCWMRCSLEEALEIPIEPIFKKSE